MKALLHAGSGRFEVAEVADPTPGPDDVVIGVSACGICGSDLKAAAMMPPSTIMGHEFYGEIVAAGRNVAEAWPIGRAAASMPLRSCGACRWCLNGDVAHCDAAAYTGLGGLPGGFAEYVAVNAATTFAVPEGGSAAGALVEPLAVGLHTVGKADLLPGQRVLVIGAGAVGATVVLWARRFGAGRVAVSDPSPERRRAAALLGADHVHDPGAGLPDERFDVVFECSGAPGMAQLAADLVEKRGRVVIAGVCSAPDQILHVSPLMKEAEIRYAVYYSVAEFELASRALAEGHIDPSTLIAGYTDFGGFDATFDALAHGRLGGKYLFRPTA